jgi:hypothetical protein
MPTAKKPVKKQYGGCANSRRAAQTARAQNRNRRNPAAAKRRATRGSGNGAAGVGKVLKTAAGLTVLGLMAKKAKNSM